MSADQAVMLRIHSGIPIVDVLGEWLPNVTDALTEMVRTLTDTGHYDIVVNVQRAALTGVAALSSLSRAAQNVRTHCGHIDVVGTKDQVNQLILSKVGNVFRLAVSEETAICRIKRMPILSSAKGCTARPVG